MAIPYISDLKISYHFFYFLLNCTCSSSASSGLSTFNVVEVTEIKFHVLVSKLSGRFVLIFKAMAALEEDP